MVYDKLEGEKSEPVISSSFRCSSNESEVDGWKKRHPVRTFHSDSCNAMQWRTWSGTFNLFTFFAYQSVSQSVSPEFRLFR